MFSGADVNVGSKERELHRLLEVLRIKADIHVLVHFSSLPPHFPKVTTFCLPRCGITFLRYYQQILVVVLVTR